MFKEHDSVVLTEDIPEKGLKAGDIGAIVDAAQSGEAFLLEFVAYDGDTVALVEVTPSQIRPAGAGDIPHARRFVA